MAVAPHDIKPSGLMSKQVRRLLAVLSAVDVLLFIAASHVLSLPGATR